MNQIRRQVLIKQERACFNDFNVPNYVLYPFLPIRAIYLYLIALQLFVPGAAAYQPGNTSSRTVTEVKRR